MNQEFKLTPAFCLFNGVGILNQEEEKISFLIENPDDEQLKNSLVKAYKCHLKSNKGKDYSEVCEQNISFVPGNRSQVRRIVSTLCEEKKSKYGVSGMEQTEICNNDSAAVLLLETIMNEAKTSGATDIHIEGRSIRFRVNGKLCNELRIDSEKSRELIQRIKVLSGMNVIESKRSQDGHFVYDGDNSVFVRTSTVSVIGEEFNSNCESMVLRLLDVNRIPLELNSLGFTNIQLEKLNEFCELKNGLIVVCGPTGSGKSTTTAAILKKLVEEKQSSLKIISLEDPPEYYLPGVTQISINENHHRGFSETLAHIFRQDPDVIMIGEIRDEITCETAIRASLTGHLVIATLHTSSAAGAFLRLENLGAQEKILASVFKGAVLQEMNFFRGQINLLADIAIPKQDFSKQLKKSESEEELEELFTHYTNIADVLGRTLGQLETAVEKIEKKPKNRISGKRQKKISGKLPVYPALVFEQTKKEKEG